MGAIKVFGVVGSIRGAESRFEGPTSGEGVLASTSS